MLFDWLNDILNSTARLWSYFRQVRPVLRRKVPGRNVVQLIQILEWEGRIVDRLRLGYSRHVIHTQYRKVLRYEQIQILASLQHPNGSNIVEAEQRLRQLAILRLLHHSR
ncbi:hypothetical protein D3C75_1077610 [compost metagenome]